MKHKYQKNRKHNRHNRDGGDWKPTLAWCNAVLANPKETTAQKATALSYRAGLHAQAGRHGESLADCNTLLAMPDAPDDFRVCAFLQRAIHYMGDDDRKAAADLHVILGHPTASDQIKTTAQIILDIIGGKTPGPTHDLYETGAPAQNTPAESNTESNIESTPAESSIESSADPELSTPQEFYIPFREFIKNTIAKQLETTAFDTRIKSKMSETISTVLAIPMLRRIHDEISRLTTLVIMPDGGAPLGIIEAGTRPDELTTNEAALCNALLDKIRRDLPANSRSLHNIHCAFVSGMLLDTPASNELHLRFMNLDMMKKNHAIMQSVRALIHNCFRSQSAGS